MNILTKYILFKEGDVTKSSCDSLVTVLITVEDIQVSFSMTKTSCPTLFKKNSQVETNSLYPTLKMVYVLLNRQKFAKDKV